MKERDSKEMEYLSEMGINQWGEGSKSGVPSIKRFENSMLRGVLDRIYDVAKATEFAFRAKYKTANEKVKQGYTEDQYVRTKVVPHIKNEFRKHKERITKMSRSGASLGKRTRKEMLNLKGQVGFRSLSAEKRRDAILTYVERKNQSPNFLDTHTLMLLTIYGGGKLK
jgi:hypothetical protein